MTTCNPCRKKALNLGASLLAGILFVSGLAISGMTNPDKIRSFLAIGTKTWEPDLMFVMASAIAIYALAHAILVRKKITLSGVPYTPPANKPIDRSLVVGATIFGAGWGLTGLCPAPALARFALADTRSLLFVTVMFVGFYSAGLWNSRQNASAVAPAREKY